MLILTRRINESIVIGDDMARVKVLGVKGNQVRLGMVADSSITIHREEIFNKILKEKETVVNHTPFSWDNFPQGRIVQGATA